MTHTIFRRPRLKPTVLVALLALAACANVQRDESEDYVEVGRGASVPESVANAQTGGSIFGPEGLAILRGSDDDEQGGGGIGVNSFLWRATLDTVSFMPLVSADPFGGVIITDWYAPPQTPAERFKVNVYILDRALRADGVRVAVFRQVRQGENWADQPPAPNTAVSMENAILQRAREFRMEAEARR